MRHHVATARGTHSCPEQSLHDSLLAKSGGRFCTHMVVKQSTLSIVAGGVFLVLAVLLGGGVFLISSSIGKQQQAVEKQAESRQLGGDLMNAANSQSDSARKFVLTADPAHFNAYWKEVNETKTRERVANRLAELDTPQDELDLLADSQQKTEPLTDSELRAMR